MAQIAQPRGPIDRRAGVIALIAHLDFAGMHPDAQPDRGQRRPLQLQRRRHRIRSPGERRHEAVALTLLDRAHPVVDADRLDITREPSTPILPFGSGAHYCLGSHLARRGSSKL